MKFANCAVILTGGLGTRLGKLATAMSKHMLPINDKFVIDYPLQTIKSMGIKDVSVILGGNHYDQLIGYLQDGTQLGFNFTYLFQNNPVGISQAIALSERFTGENNFIALLADNLFQKPIGWNSLDDTRHSPYAARIALYKHPNLEKFGVASIDKKSKRIVKIEEKPKYIDDRFDNYAITGCYQFTKQFYEYFKNTKPSLRQEFEITDVLKQYLEAGLLEYIIISGWWQDAGSVEALTTIRDLIKTEPVEF